MLEKNKFYSNEGKNILCIEKIPSKGRKMIEFLSFGERAGKNYASLIYAREDKLIVRNHELVGLTENIDNQSFIWENSNTESFMMHKINYNKALEKDKNALERELQN